MTPAQLAILKTKLNAEYAPYLPALIDTAHANDHAAKNTARALSAFALSKLTGVDPETAAKSVIDDFDDNGIDGIYYDQSNQRLFLVQSKLRETEPFGQGEALAFKNGIIDLLNQRYGNFNRHVERQKEQIDLAIGDAREIVMVLAYCSSISDHASGIMSAIAGDGSCDDERLSATWIDYGPNKIVGALLEEQAQATVNATLGISGVRKVEEPRTTYYGSASIAELASLYQDHGNALLEKNIRYFLGSTKSEVNQAIRKTLDERPGDFFYLNNGVTALAHAISQRGRIDDSSFNYSTEGLSIINGAQTVAASAQFISENPEKDISNARVMLTLIKVDANDPFGIQVTKARNHQNPVTNAQFAALDHNQERLRRELAHLGISYRYRPEALDDPRRSDVIVINEAALGLALFNQDPGTPVALKSDFSRFVSPSADGYRRTFDGNISGISLGTAVRLYRACDQAIAGNEMASLGQEKLIYRHGRYAIIWLVLSRHREWLRRTDVISASDARSLVSSPLDETRELVRGNATTVMAAALKGPLSFFRNLTDARPFLIQMRDRLNEGAP